jgi:photosystem II stability/assembly factor-like uncharacterized protein
MKKLIFYNNRVAMVLIMSCGLLACNKDDVARSGRSWTKLQTGTTQDIVVEFANENLGLIAGGDIFRTTNGGSTWSKTFTGSSGKTFLALDMIDAENAVAVGTGIIYKTEDSGQSWQSLASPVINGTFWGVAFVTRMVGFVAEGSGKIYKTTDGGVSWTNPGSIATPPLIYIRFVDTNLGFASGGSGTILKTADGGNTWNTVPYSSAQVTGIYFVDASVGYAFEHNGSVKKTVNGGASWSNQTSGVNTALRAMKFFDVNNGFAVGDSGVILSTTNGGTTWTKETSGTQAILNSISTVGNKLFVSGFNGTLLKADK